MQGGFHTALSVGAEGHLLEEHQGRRVPLIDGEDRLVCHCLAQAVWSVGNRHYLLPVEPVVDCLPIWILVSVLRNVRQRRYQRSQRAAQQKGLFLSARSDTLVHYGLAPV